MTCGSHLLEIGVEVEKAKGEIRAEALALHTQGWVSQQTPGYVEDDLQGWM